MGHAPVMVHSGLNCEIHFYVFIFVAKCLRKMEDLFVFFNIKLGTIFMLLFVFKLFGDLEALFYFDVRFSDICEFPLQHDVHRAPREYEKLS